MNRMNSGVRPQNKYKALGDLQLMVGAVKSCCQHSVQDVREPSPATVPSPASSSHKTESALGPFPGTDTRCRRQNWSLPCCRFEWSWVGAGKTHPCTHAPHYSHILWLSPSIPTPCFMLSAEWVLLLGHISVPRIGLGRPADPLARGRWSGRGWLPMPGTGRTRRLCLPVCGVGGSPSLAPEG